MKRVLAVVVAVMAAMALAPVSRALPAVYTYSKIDFPGSGTTQATGVNNSGQVVGSYGAGIGAIYADPGTRLHGFLLDRTGYHTADASDTVGTHPQAITEAGGIAGFIGDYDQRCCAHTHISGYLQRRGATQLFENNGRNMFVTDANDRGDVIGFCHDGAGHGPGFIWNDGALTEVAPEGAGSTESTYLVATDEPQIVLGGSSLGGGFSYHNGTFSPFSLPSNMHNPSVSGMNNEGDLVGVYTDDQGRRGGYLLRNGALTKINVPGGDGTEPLDVNDNRQVVGQYYVNGVPHGFIATPH